MDEYRIRTSFATSISGNPHFFHVFLPLYCFQALLTYFLYVLKWDGLGQAEREKIALHFELGGGELQIPVFVESRKRPVGGRGGGEQGCVQCI